MSNEQVALLHQAFQAHELRDNERFDDIKNDLRELKDYAKEINASLKPILETYQTVSSLGKWGMGFLVFVSVTLGIVWAFIQIAFKIKT
jgi:hypothetical protein